MRNKSWIAISYFTINSPFEKMANDLMLSAANFEIELVIYQYESRGSWKANSNMKPEVILSAMNDYPNRNIVFVDADAYFMKYPKLFDDYKYDLSVLWMYHKNSKKMVISDGTIFAKNTYYVRSVIHRWNEHMKEHPAGFEQTEFENFYMNNNLKIAPSLLPQYCMVIIDEEPIDKRFTLNDIVIAHGRSTPELKKKIK